MILVSRRDGTVRPIDPTNLPSKISPAEVTAVAVVTPGGRADVPAPKRFRAREYAASVIRDSNGNVTAERVTISADETLLTVTVGINPADPRVRIDLDRPGRRRWLPGS